MNEKKEKVEKRRIYDKISQNNVVVYKYLTYNWKHITDLLCET